MLVRIMGYCTHPTIPIDVNSDIIRDNGVYVLQITSNVSMLHYPGYCSTYDRSLC